MKKIGTDAVAKARETGDKIRQLIPLSRPPSSEGTRELSHHSQTSAETRPFADNTPLSTTGLRQRRSAQVSAFHDDKDADTTTKEVEVPVQSIAKYILVGYKSQLDPNKSFLEMTRLDNSSGREIYAVSFTTVMPTEVFYVLDRELGYKRRFYAQGNAWRQFTRALEGDEKRGHEKYWILDNVKPGEEVSVYFAPSEGSLAWSRGPIDPNLDLPLPKDQLSAEDVSAVTQFPIDSSTLSHILLMAADPLARCVIAVFRLVPHIIMVLLLFWVMQSAPKQTTVSFYQADSYLEWINVFVIYFANVTRKGFDVGEQISAIREAFALAKKVHDNEQLARGIRFGAVCELINVLQDPIAFVLSLYVAVYLSDDVFLNVLLNVVALEFVTDVDEDMTDAFTSWRYGEGAAISVALLDITYSVDESIEFWHDSSNSSSEKVHEDLRKGEVSNSTRWQLLISKSNGLGLLDTMDDGREIVSVLQLRLDVVKWDTMQEPDLVKQGGLYLAATTDHVWEHHISKHQRAQLFKHFPGIAIKFPWIGSVKLDKNHSIGAQHAPFLVEMIKIYPEVTAVSCRLERHDSDACVKVLSKGLMDNKTLKTLSLCASGVTDTGAMEIAKLLRCHSAMDFFWLIGNRGIGNSGALNLAAALCECEDANATLHRIYMGVNTISADCQEKCVQKTNGRMVFYPDDHPVCTDCIHAL